MRIVVIPKPLALFYIVLLTWSTGAPAQSPNDFLNMFRGFVQQGMAQTAQSEWRRLPASETSCLDNALRAQGASVDALVNRGIMPFDPRLEQMRATCRNQVAQGPQRANPDLSLYVVDGLALGGHVRFDSDAYKQYHCTPSDKFPSFTWCHKDKTAKTNRDEITTSNSILHSADGTAVYVNRYIEPAFFAQNEVQTEINRLSARFGERPREFRLPQRQRLPNAVIAVWGKVNLEPLDPNDVATVASGGTIKGLSISFLGDLQRSAKVGVPVYRLAGGAGYVWSATFNDDGRGVLRFLTVDASRFAPPMNAPVQSTLPDQANTPASSPQGAQEGTARQNADAEAAKLAALAAQEEAARQKAAAEAAKQLAQAAQEQAQQAKIELEKAQAQHDKDVAEEARRDAERPKCETLIVSKPYFVAACIAQGMRMSQHHDGLSDAEGLAQQERQNLACASNSLNRLQEMAKLSAARIVSSHGITPLMDFADAMKLECTRAAQGIFGQSRAGD